MQITIITLFPQVFEQVFSVSILKRAQEENKLKIKLLNLRDFGIGKHKVVDDRPYGGGAGMVYRPQPYAFLFRKPASSGVLSLIYFLPEPFLRWILKKPVQIPEEKE